MYRHTLIIIFLAWYSMLPAQYLDFKSTTTNFLADFDGTNNSFFQLSENGVRRGYFGSFSGTADDVDIGTSLDNATGDLHFTIQATPRMTLKQSGNVGIGTTNPSEKLHIIGNIRLIDDGDILGLDRLEGWNDLRLYGSPGGDPDIFISSSGDVGIGTTTPSATLHVDGSLNIGDHLIAPTPISIRVWTNLLPQDPNPTFHFNDLGSTDHWWDEVYGITWKGPSDIRYKKDVKDLHYGLQELLQMRPVQFKWKHKDDNKDNYGLIAQELRQIIPEIVAESENTKPLNAQDGDSGLLNVSYLELIPILIKAIQEQDAKIMHQENTISDLKQHLEEIQLLKDRIKAIENELK